MKGLEAVKFAIDSKDIDAFGEALHEVENRESLVPLFTLILPDEWHEAHEDIVFELGLIGDPLATDVIAKVSTVSFQYLIDWGNLHEFQRKCAYALARIGTEESRKALEKLSKNSDPYISKYGREGLEHWPIKR